MSLFNKRKIFGNAVGMAIATLTLAGIKFISVPLLLSVYGKEKFGVLAIALSINLYLGFLALGVPGALVKFLSAALGDRFSLIQIGRSSLSFFTGVGLLNALVLVFFAAFGCKLFSFGEADVKTLQLLFVISSISTLFAWVGAYVDALITAKEDLVFLSFTRVGQALIELVGVLCLCMGLVSWSIIGFFIFQQVCRSLMLVLKINRSARLGFPLTCFVPGWNWSVFKPILKFSSALLIVQIMAATSNHFRPVLMAVRNPDGAGISADYRILFTIINFALMGSAFLRTSLFPSLSRSYAAGQSEAANEMVFRAARYGWMLLGLPLCVGIALSAELLELYVGTQFLYLTLPLQIWLFALSVQLYNGPGFAAVMGGGNMKLFALSLSFSTIIGMVYLWMSAPSIGIYSASFSTLILNAIHLFLFHAFVMRSVDGLNPGKMFFKAYLPPCFGILLAVLSSSGLSDLFVMVFPVRLIVKAFSTAFVYILVIRGLLSATEVSSCRVYVSRFLKMRSA